MISVLIPIFNFKIEKLVDTLLAQSMESGIRIEIICLDDGSRPSIKRDNECLRHKFMVNYVELSENLGRAKVRNWLSKLSRYDYQLFLDCDSKIESKDFLANYYDARDISPVIYGGRIYTEAPPRSRKKRLHWKYGKNIESQPVANRTKRPYLTFMSNNFLIRKDIFEKFGFNEQIMGYGYEDIAFAQDLEKNGIPILHIDNPVVHLGLEMTTPFLDKSLEAVENLYRLHSQGLIKGTRLLKWAGRLKKAGIAKPAYKILTSRQEAIRNKLFLEDPSLYYFSLFKLHHFLHICYRNS